MDILFNSDFQISNIILLSADNLSFSNFNNVEFVIILIALAVLTCIFRMLIVIKTDSKSINRPLGVIAVYLIAICLLICLISTQKGIFYIHTNGNPKDVVNSFYTSLLNRDFDNAYKHLNNCTSLGLENPITDSEGNPINNLIANALKNSYSVSISNNAVISGLTASQNVDFTYLDLASLEEATASHIEEILDKKVKTLPKSELYTEDGHYLKTLMDTVYDEALNEALKDPEAYYKTLNYDLSLQYIKGHWYINTNEDMIKGFAGGQ